MKQIRTLFQQQKSVAPLKLSDTKLEENPKPWIPPEHDTSEEKPLIDPAMVEAAVAQASMAPSASNQRSDATTDNITNEGLNASHEIRPEVTEPVPLDETGDTTDDNVANDTVEAHEGKRPPEEEAAYREGLEAGLATATEQIQDMQRSLRASVQELNEIGSELTARYRAEAVELATVIAKAVIGAELTTNPDAILTIIKRAVEAVPEGCAVTIKCHPDDFELIESEVPNLEMVRGHPVEVRSGTDSDIERGGCIVRFESGTVDAQASASVEAIRESIEAHLAGRSPSEKPEVPRETDSK